MDNGFNIFEGITRNWFFIGINFVMVGGQVMIMFVGGKAFTVQPLTGIQWAISIVLGAISLPIAVVIRLIPDGFLRKIAPQFMISTRSSPQYKSDPETGDRFEWNRGIEEIRQELSFLKLVRGGRLNQLKFGQHNIREMKENFSHMFRGSKAELTASDDGGAGVSGASLAPSSASHRRRRSRANSAIAAAAMVPGVVAGGVGGWSPVERASSYKDIELLPPPSTKSSSSEAHALQQLAPQSTATSATHVESNGSSPEPPPK